MVTTVHVKNSKKNKFIFSPAKAVSGLVSVKNSHDKKKLVWAHVNCLRENCVHFFNPQTAL